jgi:hypothetical protein
MFHKDKPVFAVAIKKGHQYLQRPSKGMRCTLDSLDVTGSPSTKIPIVSPALES